MARSGRFGRNPRSAPSLTNTLVAIAREFQAQRAENIMSAWQKGGSFEGKKATDEVVLAFWRDRRDGVSRDDPLYDTYSNAVTQLDYNINESKMTAKYAQKGATDAQMVAFYMGWAKKVPKNSEFYRVLMRDAGQYMRNSRANSEAEARRAAEERYQRQQNGTRAKMEAAGEYAIDTFRRLAQSGNASRAMGGLIAAPGSGSDLTDFDPSDPAAMMQLLDLVAPRKTRVLGVGFSVADGKAAGSKEVLYHDDDGKAVTGADIIARFRKLDPSFQPGAPFDINYVTGLLDRQLQGINERIKRATDTGHMTDVSSLTKSKEYVAMLNRQVAAYPVQKAYQEARADYDSVVADPTASPQAVLNAWQKYSATLTTLANDDRIEANDSMRALLTSEAQGKGGAPTLNETFTGLQGGAFTGEAKDAAENAQNIEFMQAQVDAVQSGKAAWTYGITDSNGIFIPQAGGKVIGAATPEAIEAGGTNAQVVMVPDPRGGVPLKMAVTATPVFAVARNPVTGEPLNATDGQPIGYVYDMPKGNTTVTTYGFQTKDGFVFSSNPPWADDLQPKGVKKDGQNRLEVDFTPIVEKAILGGKDPYTGEYKVSGDQLLAKDAVLSGGFEVKGAKPGKPGSLWFDPSLVAQMSDDRDITGSGKDPTSDFHSLTLATLMRDQEGMNILSNLDKNPAFKSQMETDNYRYAGVQFDPKTALPIAGTGDQNRLNAAMGQMNMASNSKSFGEFVSAASQTWSRLQTGTPYIRKEGYAGLGQSTAEFAKLATDLVKGTPFEALGNAFLPQTNNIRRFSGKEEDDRFAIKPGKAIVAPVIKTTSTTKVTGTPVGGPTSTYTPPAQSQTGSSAPTKPPTQPTQGGSHPPGYGPWSSGY